VAKQAASYARAADLAAQTQRELGQRSRGSLHHRGPSMALGGTLVVQEIADWQQVRRQPPKRTSPLTCRRLAASRSGLRTAALTQPSDRLRARASRREVGATGEVSDGGLGMRGVRGRSKRAACSLRTPSGRQTGSAGPLIRILTVDFFRWHEPAPSGDERTDLTAWLEYQRHEFQRKLRDLDAEQLARWAVPPVGSRCWDLSAT